MRLRRPWLVGILLLVPTAAFGHDHKADAFFGQSFAFGSLFIGSHETLAVPIEINDDRRLSFFVDLTVYKGSEDDERATRVLYMGGARWSHALGHPKTSKNLIFGHLLVGRLYDHLPDATPSNVVLGFGGGYEFEPDGKDTRWAPRGQLDIVFVKGGDNFVRLSGGVVYRWPKE
jgi:hypothetical protein